MVMHILAKLQSWHNPTIVTKSLIDDPNSTGIDHKGALYVMGHLDSHGQLRVNQIKKDDVTTINELIKHGRQSLWLNQALSRQFVILGKFVGAGLNKHGGNKCRNKARQKEPQSTPKYYQACGVDVVFPHTHSCQPDGL